ncbi:MAG: ABC transporter permease subunit [SAR324 cluster bacterium]|nr:ABC transporter permease subunit [SAR324 cluster bacterium]
MNGRSSVPAPDSSAPRPPKSQIGAQVWVRKNLFGNWFDTLLTLLSLWLIYQIVSVIFSWAIIDAVVGEGPKVCEGAKGACWAFIQEMWELFIVGLYPFEERYRPYTAFLILVLLCAATFVARVRRWPPFYLLWALAPFAVFFLIRGGTALNLPLVDTSLWGGLMLTLVLAVVSLGLGFPLGILLALGRRSRMPVLRGLCVAYIELVRGVPLITVLFLSSVMLPLFLPAGIDIDKILRALIGITLFAAAYLAEVVRGGLQGLPSGQEDAAKALGMNSWQTMVFIILPQVLRMVIPPLVSTFIGLLKDTSLVSIIGLLDLLGMAAATTANPDWLGRLVEAYVFVAVIYWVFCYSMSRYSLFLERKYKTGH